MILSLLFQDPILFLAWAISMVLAISIHEFSHAAAAYSLGDPTAKNLGRLTLNPLAHLDPLGTVLMLFAGFGWGKPVPFNAYNLRSQRFGPALISLAGPISNFIVVITVGLFLRFGYPLLGLSETNALFQFLLVLVILNAGLMTFNLFPIPPLDGSKVLFALLPPSKENIKIFLSQYGPFILIGLILFDGILPFSIFGSLFRVILSGVYLLIFGSGIGPVDGGVL